MKVFYLFAPNRLVRQWRCQFQELLRGKNSNALEGIKNEEICIAGNKVSCPTTQCDLKKFIVLGVTASIDLDIHVNPLGLARQSRYKTSDIFLVNVSAKLFSQNIVEFRERCEGKQKFSIPKSASKRLTGLRTRNEQCAHKNICIQNAAQ